MIPLFHDFHGESVVIFGGGAVAARKAETFGGEAEVTVVSKTFHPRLRDLDCTRIERSIESIDIESVVSDTFLVVPATDDADLNDRIEAVAREEGCLVNRVDTVGDTITPSIVESESITVAISTGGRSPTVSAYLGERLEAEIQRADGMVAIQSWLRDRLADRPPGERRSVLRRVVEHPAIWDAIEVGDMERAHTLARREKQTLLRITNNHESPTNALHDG